MARLGGLGCPGLGRSRRRSLVVERILRQPGTAMPCQKPYGYSVPDMRIHARHADVPEGEHPAILAV